MNMTIDTLFVPGLQPALKHPTVFKKFDELQVGDSFLIVNDHDPIPLYYQMKAERGEVFEWNKIENGPETWRVEIKRTAAATVKAPEVNAGATGNNNDIFTLNVPSLEPRLKHPTIFKYFDALQPGEAFQILNDHDPKPLYYQLLGERGNIFTWNYLEQGPVNYRVQIRKNALNATETIGQIAAKDLRKAEVFKKYGIDFCCGGKKSLKDVCEEKGLNLKEVENALEEVKESSAQVENYDKWSPDFLADYIYNKHHLFYYEEEPMIRDLMVKVVDHHGDNFPALQEVAVLYSNLIEELNSHFAKEEKILFPFIKALVAAKKTGNIEEAFGKFSLGAPVQMMESEHEAAGEILEEISAATNNYTPPAGACNSFQYLYKKLKALQDDLHQHIHLENNILFPKALKLEKELRG
jgi:regulator of cell morphogenesis and NO signaling